MTPLPCPHLPRDYYEMDPRRVHDQNVGIGIVGSWNVLVGCNQVSLIKVVSYYIEPQNDWTYFELKQYLLVLGTLDLQPPAHPIHLLEYALYLWIKCSRGPVVNAEYTRAHILWVVWQHLCRCANFGLDDDRYETKDQLRHFARMFSLGEMNTGYCNLAAWAARMSD